MNYPDMEEVERADRVQLARWMRFLPSPSFPAVERYDRGLCVYEEAIAEADRNRVTLTRIQKRFKEAGGMTPEISRLIGWDRA